MSSKNKGGREIRKPKQPKAVKAPETSGVIKKDQVTKPK